METKALAAFWRLSVRTTQKLLADQPPTPLASAAATLRWFAALPSARQAKYTRSFRRRIDELRLLAERGHPLPAPGDPVVVLPAGAHASAAASSPPSVTPAGAGLSLASPSPLDPAPTLAAPNSATPNPQPPAPAGGAIPDLTDPDYADFIAAHPRNPDQAAATDPFLAELHRQRAFALYKLDRARLRGAAGSVKDAIEEARHLSSVIHDEELRADKLNRELGESLPRPAAERLLRALAYWLARSTDEIESAIVPRLAAATATGVPLYREEIRALVEPALLTSLILAPLHRASRLNIPATLPPWALAALRDGLTATLAAPAEVHARLYADPLPPPPPGLADGAGI